MLFLLIIVIIIARDLPTVGMSFGRTLGLGLFWDSSPRRPASHPGLGESTLGRVLHCSSLGAGLDSGNKHEHTVQPELSKLMRII